MNVWKPIAMVAVCGLVASVGTQIAAAEGVCNNQPNMQSALDHLRAARTALERAEHNKGGWRDRAIGATDNAINETKKGCEFADKH